MRSYTTIANREISLDALDGHEKNIVHILKRSNEDPHLFSPHTLHILGRTVQDSLAAIAEGDPLLQRRTLEMRSKALLAEIRDDVWSKLLKTAGITDSNVQADTNPPWSRGVYIQHIALPKNATPKDRLYFASLLDTKDIGEVQKIIKAEHEANGRELHGLFTGSDLLETAIIRLALCEERSANQIFVNAFKRTHQRMLKRKKAAMPVDHADIHRQNDLDSRALQSRYGTCIRTIVENEATLGSYYGWRMATTGSKAM